MRVTGGGLARRTSRTLPVPEIYRSLEAATRGGAFSAIRIALAEEEARERADDETYWRPLLVEQEAMRHVKRRAQEPARGPGGPAV